MPSLDGLQLISFLFPGRSDLCARRIYISIKLILASSDNCINTTSQHFLCIHYAVLIQYYS